jgi:DNA-binding NarL/FixJ family response regulator
LLGAAQAACEAVGAPQLPHHGQFNAAVTQTRNLLGEERFRAAWEAGGGLTASEAIQEAFAIVPTAAPKPESASQPFGLTPRELDVLTLIAAGLSDREIAEALFISPRTAQKHAATIFDKLGVGSRTAAATVALRAGLLPEG